MFPSARPDLQAPATDSIAPENREVNDNGEIDEVNLSFAIGTPCG
jgi:hypothetical protein